MTLHYVYGFYNNNKKTPRAWRRVANGSESEKYGKFKEPYASETI